MKKALILTTTLMLAGCANNLAGVTLPTTKDGKQQFSVSGVMHYNPPATAIEIALRETAEGLTLPCPAGIKPTDDFKAAVIANWAGVEHVHWTGVVECKNKKVDWELKK